MSNAQPAQDFEVQFAGFDRLMGYRVREILLVASPYDAFIIAEDDKLTELIFSEYLGLQLRYAPRVTRVSTATEALELIRKEPFQQGSFDLIITMLRVGEMKVGAFAQAVKRVNPGLPVYFLAHHLVDVQRLSEEDRRAIDRPFLWTGNARILLSIVKQIEDRRNIEADIDAAGVQTILLVEDSVRYYSHFLPMLYTEMMEQTRQLMAESLNLTHKMLRMRARPKILLATSYEEALELYERYKLHLLGIITDLQFPRGGKLDPEAGLRLIELVKADAMDLPVLLQSTDKRVAARAQGLGASFIDKASPTLLDDLRGFILSHMGFGEFVFRLPDGTEVERVSDLRGLLEALKAVPDSCLAYHAGRNHFSTWLMARTEFELAHRIRPRTVGEFGGVANLRRYLIDTIGAFLHKTQLGVVTDFSTRFFDEESPFVRIGTGSLGGKGRGLAFFNSLLSRRALAASWPGVRVRTPNTAVLAADIFEQFLAENSLVALVRSEPDDETLRQAFLAARLPQKACDSLGTFVDKVQYPLAVRSSSLLEDSQAKPFAGIYETYMLPNNHPDPELRLRQLCRAVQLVYASTYSQQARAYLGATPHLQEDERMSVLVQRLVGRAYGDRFYPDVSGVAQSCNYYPVGPQRACDGIAYVGLGLGKTVMEGRRTLDFSPAHPRHLFQFSSVRETLDNCQREFMALDLSRPDFIPGGDSGADLLLLGLDSAERDGALAALGSTFSPENDRIYDGIGRPGARLVTFAGVLKHGAFPLCEILRALLAEGERAVGCPVEIEFAANLEPAEFHVLQIRPMISWSMAQDAALTEAHRARAVCYSPRALGHGVVAQVRDLLFVKPEAFTPGRTRPIADEIGAVNAALQREGRGYVLIGPGRWGSSDQSLGIPVQWPQISASRVIVETALEGFAVEPSYGTHFLHNVISSGIGYLTVGLGDGEGGVDWDWLRSQEPLAQTPHLRHLRLSAPLDIRIDGEKGEGSVLKP